MCGDGREREERVEQPRQRQRPQPGRSLSMRGPLWPLPQSSPLPPALHECSPPPVEERPTPLDVILHQQVGEESQGLWLGAPPQGTAMINIMQLQMRGTGANKPERP